MLTSGPAVSKVHADGATLLLSAAGIDSDLAECTEADPVHAEPAEPTLFSAADGRVITGRRF
jgi:hypothetical protein